MPILLAIGAVYIGLSALGAALGMITLVVMGVYFIFSAR